MPSVLICEDDPAVASLLELAFRLDGHDVEVFCDGEAAAQRLRGPRPDLAVLDIMLPGLDGLEVLGQLRADEDWSTCHVIVVTALAGDEHIWEAWSKGANYLLTKPFDVTHLLQVADRLLTVGTL